MTYNEGFKKIIERGGVLSLWKGNVTSVIHRFPFSAINFYVYENMLVFLHERRIQNRSKNDRNTLIQNSQLGNVNRRFLRQMQERF